MQCPKCDAIFKTTSNFNAHMRRKTPCERVIKTNMKSGFQCLGCNRSMSSRRSLSKHFETCGVYIERITNNSNSTDILKNNSNGDNNDINTVNNYNGPITFNYSNMQDLVDKIMNLKGKNKTDAGQIRGILRGLIYDNEPKELIERLIKFVHNNKNFPEGKNIFIGSQGSKYEDMLIIFQNNQWIQTNIDQVIIIAIAEVQKALSQLEDLDHTDRNTAKCIETLNDIKFKLSLSMFMMKAIEKLELSKKNPDVDVIKGTELKKPVNVCDDSDTEYSETESGTESDTEEEVPIKTKKLKKLKVSQNPTTKTPQKPNIANVKKYIEALISENKHDQPIAKINDTQIDFDEYLDEMQALEFYDYHECNVPIRKPPRQIRIVLCTNLSEFDRSNYEDAHSNYNSDDEDKPDHTGLPQFTGNELYFKELMGSDYNEEVRDNVRRR